MKTPISRYALALLALTIFPLAGVRGAAPSEIKMPDRTIAADIPAADAFDRTILWLEDQGYFIESVDRASGFVSAKLFIENKKVFTYKKGELRNVSLFVKSENEDRSEIRLSIYSAYLTTAGTQSGVVYSYDEQGLNTDESLYAEMLGALQSSLTSPQSR